MISLKMVECFPEGLTLLGSEPDQPETAATTPFAALLAHLQVSGLIPAPPPPEPAARPEDADRALFPPVGLTGVLPQPPRLAARPPAPPLGPEERLRAKDLPMTRFAPEPAPVVVKPPAETAPAIVTPLDTAGHTASSVPVEPGVNQANVRPGLVVPAKKLTPPPRQHGGPAEGLPILLARKPDTPPSPPSPEWQTGDAVPAERQPTAWPATPEPRVTGHQWPAEETAARPSLTPPEPGVNQANVRPGIVVPAKKLAPPPRQHGGPAEGLPILLARKPGTPPSPPSPEWRAGRPERPEIERPAPRPAALFPIAAHPQTPPGARELTVAVRLTGAEVLSPAQTLPPAAPRTLQTPAVPVEHGPHPPVALDFTLLRFAVTPLQRAPIPPAAYRLLQATPAQPEALSEPAPTLQLKPLGPSWQPSLPQHQWPELPRPSAEGAAGYPVRPGDLPHSLLSLTPPASRQTPPSSADGEGLAVSSGQQPPAAFEAMASPPAMNQPAPLGGTARADLIRLPAVSQHPANDPAGLVGVATSLAPRFNWRGQQSAAARLGQALAGVLPPLSKADANHQFPLARPGSEALPEAFPAPPVVPRGLETTGLPWVITPETATAPLLAAVEAAVAQPGRPVVAAPRADTSGAPTVAALELQVEMSEWGQVRISARDTGETVSAQLLVSNQPALQALRAVEGEVRQSFSAQGLQLGSFDVSCQGDSRREPAPPALGHSPLPLAEVRDNSPISPRTRPAARPFSRQRVDLFA